jgi:hypothetical protein
MRRRLATLAAVSMFALVLGAAPAMAAGSPLTSVTLPADQLGTICGYTPVSGSFTETFRTADAVTDPQTGEIVYIPAAHVTLHNVVATRDGASFKVVGTETYNDLKGHLTLKIMFVAKGGGLADSVNVVLRYDHNGVLFVAHENDSCHMYG